MINTLTIIGDNALQVKVFAYFVDKSLNKLFLPDFNATIRLNDEKWEEVEFTLELSEGIPYGSKEFLRLQFSLWTEKELLGNLYMFSICSKDKENITKIKFKINLWNRTILL